MAVEISMSGQVERIPISFSGAASSSFAINFSPEPRTVVALQLNPFTFTSGQPTIKVKAYTNKLQSRTVVMNMTAYNSSALVTAINTSTNTDIFMRIGTKGSLGMLDQVNIIPYGLKLVYNLATAASSATVTGELIVERDVR